MKKGGSLVPMPDAIAWAQVPETLQNNSVSGKDGV